VKPLPERVADAIGPTESTTAAAIRLAAALNISQPTALRLLRGQRVEYGTAMATLAMLESKGVATCADDLHTMLKGGGR
jgi:hypothetical protein